MDFEQIKAQEAQYMMPAYSRFDAAMVRGKGAVAYDADGREYLDFTSGVGVNALGFCDEAWVQAVTAQAGTLQHISNLYYNPVQTQLAEMLCKCAGFARVFFGNSGAEANECAIKLARKYAEDTCGKHKNQIITLVNSFHGRTVTTLTATGQDSFHAHFQPLTPGFVYAVANDLDSVRALLNDNTCAVMIELVQGEGGVMPLEQQFVTELAALCQQHNVLLIVDEVQTGMGRTGTLFCYEQYGIVPDILTSSKALGGGLPIGACLCSEKLGGVLSAGLHGSTFGGNPVACAGALSVLQRVADPAFLQEVRRKGEHLRQRLAEMPNVAQVRGVGMMLGIVLEHGTAKDVAQRCLQNGLLVLTAKTLVRLLPPLTITMEEIDRGLAILEQVLAQV